jgi:FkbH-like protein
MPSYEFDKYEPKRHHLQTQPTEPYVPFRNARRRAFVQWGEHCTECAAPDCFSTCSLYQPRPDRRCRRFEFGMYPNPAFPTGYGRASEVVFKRWGLLTGYCNAKMLPSPLVGCLEFATSVLSPVVNSIGRFLDKRFHDIRFSYLTFALLARFNKFLLKHGRSSRPDAFVFECYNPGTSPVVVQLILSYDRRNLPPSLRPDQLPPPFVVKFTIPPGYFRHDIHSSSFEQILETNLPFGISVAPDAGDGGAHLVFLTLDFVTYDQPNVAGDRAGSGAELISIQPAAITPPKSSAAAAERPAAKCVVFDLDQTLWSGILLEGKVTLKPGVRELLATLDSRGILLSLASKNSREHAQEQLTALGIEEYFLYPQINWGRKSDSLKAIAKDIDIGIDTLIFVDDNPFDRDDVTAALPQVEVMDETNLNRLLDHPRLQGSTSAEAKVRRQLYRRAIVRSDAAKEFGDDYIGFLRSCEIQLEIRVLTPADLGRVSELAQRTNQLNFSGAKYKGEDVASFMTDPTLENYVLECSDKYGSYGIVGFCVARRSPGVVLVLELMLSCRVQGKFIEQGLFHYLVSQDTSTNRLEITFKKTNRNAPAQAVLRKLGFDIEQEGVLVRDVNPGDWAVDFMKLVVPEPFARNVSAQ